ncbi:class I SAM-dependent methyltransferase [Aneurinibacillus tyrosinisolvens]|uniref:class I SAM-dependent methyltransferase n=1 Tax=Aneurinibacillus tyrosinisolvens TaxID=1443435 RepID=UPI00063FC4FC|nr:class I SAM-dependent methyltransferase [Aneurinibacillus tyrosinisolvens]
MIITTPHEPNGQLIAAARLLSGQLGAAYVERRKASIARLHKLDPEIVVVTKDGLRAYSAGREAPFFFHPGMAMLRIKRLLSGDNDLMVRACGLTPGDSFLDCTLGLAADAIVASYVAGQSGKVVGLESQAIPACIVADGLQRYETDLPQMREAMARIEVIAVHHLTFLRQCENNSFDVVYFDPMFFEAVPSSESISILRPFANYESLATEAIEEAKRVAVKRVVMKNHDQSPDFDRLGFKRIKRAERAFTYGIIETGGAQR